MIYIIITTTIITIPRPNIIEKMLMRRGVGISHIGDLTIIIISIPITINNNITIVVVIIIILIIIII